MKGFVFLLCFLYPIAHANEINIVTEVFPDFQYLDANNQLAGRSVEKVKNALDAAGISYTMSANNWSVSYNAALRDKNTCIFSIVRLPPRENNFVWIAELEEFESAIYGLKSRGIKLKTLHDAKRYKIAVLRDNFSHHYLLERGFNESRHLLLIDNLDKIDKLITSTEIQTEKNSKGDLSCFTTDILSQFESIAERFLDSPVTTVSTVTLE